jgi:transcriptional regulator with XRE-family HTH domain
MAIRLRELRESKGMSQNDLARLSGVSTQIIDRLERGNDRHGFKNVKKLAHALGLNPNELIAQTKATRNDEFAMHRFPRVQSTIDDIIAESIEETSEIDHDKAKASLIAIMSAYLRAAESSGTAAIENFSDGFKRHMEERYPGTENQANFEAVHKLYSKLVISLGWEAIPWYP